MAVRSMLLVVKKAGPMSQLRSNMLSKNKRLTTEVFQAILKGGKTLSTPFFLFHYRHSANPRYAFVAPKGLFKTAVGRNKYRRLGYNILRKKEVKTGSGIFIYKKQAILASRKDLELAINQVFQKIGL